MAGIKQIGGQPKPQRKPTVQQGRKDRWLEDSLDDVLKGYMSPQREGVFYPSSLGNPCDRFLYFAYTGQLKGQPLEANLKRIFDTGNALEERLERYFTKMGIYLNREVAVKYEHPPISGRIDFLIQHDSYGILPVESKTINTLGFGKLKKPKDDHALQLQIYLHLGGYEVGTVFYENKNDQKIKTFLIERSDEEWEKLMTRCFKIMDMTPLDVPDKCSGPPWCGCKGIE